MTLHLPVDDIVQMRAQGMTLRAIASRLGCTAPTVMRRLSGPRERPIVIPPNAEQAWRRLMARTPHRFNHVTDGEVRVLRDLIGWTPLQPDDGETTCGD